MCTLFSAFHNSSIPPLSLTLFTRLLNIPPLYGLLMPRCSPASTRDEFDNSLVDVCLFISMPSLQVKAKLHVGDLHDQLGDGGFNDCMRVIDSLIRARVEYTTSVPELQRRVLICGSFFNVERGIDAVVWLLETGCKSFTRKGLTTSLGIYMRGQMQSTYAEWRVNPDAHTAAVQQGCTMLPSPPQMSDINPAFTPRRTMRSLAERRPEMPTVTGSGPMDEALERFSSGMALSSPASRFPRLPHHEDMWYAPTVDDKELDCTKDPKRPVEEEEHEPLFFGKRARLRLVTDETAV